MKKILVTGGAGFLGSNLVHRLIEQDYNVVILDNFSSGKLQNLEKISDKIEIIEHDIINPVNINVDKAGLDYILNFACPASPPRYQADPIHTTKTSIIGGLNMLELARKNNAKILQASTSEVYGDPLVHPQTEKYWGHVNSIGIRSCYDEGKRCLESLFFDYKRTYGLDIKVIRIFNTYGPNMDPNDGRVVSNFIVKALTGEPLEIYGDGSQSRSFCYVDDLIDGIISMMKSSCIGPINLGNPNEFTIKELAELVINITGSGSKIIFKDLPKDDPTRRKPDISKAREILNWEPKVQLKEGLKKTISYFDKLLLCSEKKKINEKFI